MCSVLSRVFRQVYSHCLAALIMGSKIRRKRDYQAKGGKGR